MLYKDSTGITSRRSLLTTGRDKCWGFMGISADKRSRSLGHVCGRMRKFMHKPFGLQLVQPNVLRHLPKACSGTPCNLNQELQVRVGFEY